MKGDGDLYAGTRCADGCRPSTRDDMSETQKMWCCTCGGAVCLECGRAPVPDTMMVCSDCSEEHAEYRRAQAEYEEWFSNLPVVVAFVPWSGGWELHVEGVGVTQARHLRHVERQVRDLCEAMNETIVGRTIWLHFGRRGEREPSIR